MKKLFEILETARGGQTVKVSHQEAAILLLENPRCVGTFILSGEKDERVSWIGGGGIQSITFRCQLGSSNSLIFWSSDHRQAKLEELSQITLSWSGPWLPPTAREMAGCM